MQTSLETAARLPDHAGQLLLVIVDILRVEGLLDESNRQAFRRWAKNGRAPGKKVCQRLALDIVKSALPAKPFTHILGLPRDTAVPALAVALARALAYFDDAADPEDFLRALAVTVATLLARFDNRVLTPLGNGAVAQAPAWLFAGRRRSPSGEVVGVRPAVTRAAERLAAHAKKDRAGRLRKNLASMTRGTPPHFDTLHEVAKRTDDNSFPFQWALEEAILRFHVDPLTAVLFLQFVDALAADVRARLPSLLDPESFLSILSGRLFDDDAAPMLLRGGLQSGT